MRHQMREVSALSQGIRGLQAKMQVLREDTARSLGDSEDVEDVAELGNSLMSQYEAIGADLHSLVEAWKAGRNSIAINMNRHGRRLSHVPKDTEKVTRHRSRFSMNGILTPAALSPSSLSNFSGATAVDDGGSPTDALRTLNGDTPQRNSMISNGTSSDESELFEGVALPRYPTNVPTEDPASLNMEEMSRQSSLRERRQITSSMMKELQTVIGARPQRASSAAPRVTSL